MLNFALGPQTARGKNTLVAIDPTPLSAKHLQQGLQAAADEELHYQRAKQADPSYERQLHGWNYVDGLALPANSAEYGRARELAESLDANSLAKLVGGYGGERGNKPTGAKALELATDALYNASYGIDTLTGARLNYKQNAGHVHAFKNHGEGVTRPEQARVNKATQAAEGLEKLMVIDEAQDSLRAAELYAKDPVAFEQMLSELPHTKREHRGWNPELNKVKADAVRFHLV